MSKKRYIKLTIVIALLGVVVGKKLQPLVIQRFASNPIDYCDFNGIYYSPSSGMYDPILGGGYTFGGMLYAYVCNINQINTRVFDLFPDTKVYGTVQGNIDHIPETIAEATALEYLQVHDQKLTSLPEQIGDLTKLKTLKLAGNNLKNLPESIGNLSNLEHLELQDNVLTSLPSTLTRLEKLRFLDLRKNPGLKTLPAGMENMKQLEYLYLGDTNISPEEKTRLQLELPKTKILK